MKGEKEIGFLTAAEDDLDEESDQGAIQFWTNSTIAVKSSQNIRSSQIYGKLHESFNTAPIRHGETESNDKSQDPDLSESHVSAFHVSSEAPPAYTHGGCIQIIIFADQILHPENCKLDGKL